MTKFLQILSYITYSAFFLSYFSSKPFIGLHAQVSDDSVCLFANVMLLIIHMSSLHLSSSLPAFFCLLSQILFSIITSFHLAQSQKSSLLYLTPFLALPSSSSIRTSFLCYPYYFWPFSFVYKSISISYIFHLALLTSSLLPVCTSLYSSGKRHIWGTRMFSGHRWWWNTRYRGIVWGEHII